MKIKLVVVCLVLGVVLMLPYQAGAQRAKGIGIAPALQELTLEEDQDSTSFELNISNTNEQTVSLRLSTMDFGALDESGGIAFLGRTSQEVTPYSLSQWLVLERDSVTLEPGQSQIVKITVNNRQDLAPGGHYGAVFVAAANDNDTAQDSLSLVPAASTLVLLRKTGGEMVKLELDSTKANKTWLNVPNSITLRFQNSGNVHVVPRGTVELFGPSGSRLARGVINSQSGFILPESFRQFQVNLGFDKQPWLPGKYRVVTTWRHNETEEFNISEESVWYIGKLALWTLAISSLGVVLFLYIRYRRRPVARGQ